MKVSPYQLIFCTLSLIVAAFPIHAESLSGETICICEDVSEWPPYHYLKRKDGNKTKEAVGYGVDVLNEIFTENGINFTITFMPWKRCLSELELGKKYQMILSASYSTERDRTYHLVNWYKTNVYYFYSKKHHPDGLRIEKLSDLKKYELGGLLGYNYEYLGDLEKKMDKGAVNFDAMIEKLHRGHSDITFEQYEIIAGSAATGKNYFGDKNLGYARLPGVEPIWFNMMISKNYKYAYDLKRVVSEGVAELLWSGKHGALLKNHGLTAQ